MSALRQKLSRHFQPDAKLARFAHKIASYAHKDWVVWFFFIVYFLDSFLIFLPAESILALTLLLAPEKTRAWTLAAIAGAMLGFILFYFLSLSSFQPFVIELIHNNDMSHAFDKIVNSASKYGYLNLILAVSTVVPPVACLVAGILIGLNPFVVFLIVSVAKLFRIFLMIFLFRYLKVSIVGIKHRLEHRRDKSANKDEV